MVEFWDHFLEHGEFLDDKYTAHLVATAKSNPTEAMRLIDAVAERPDSDSAHVFLADCVVDSLRTNWDQTIAEIVVRMKKNPRLSDVLRQVHESDVPEPRRAQWRALTGAR